MENYNQCKLSPNKGARAYKHANLHAKGDAFFCSFLLPSLKAAIPVLLYCFPFPNLCHTTVPHFSAHPLFLSPPCFCLGVHRSWYFSVHIACVLIALALPVKPRHLRTTEQQRSGRQTQLRQHGMSSRQDHHHRHQHQHHHHDNHHQQHQHPSLAADSNCIQKDKTS